MKRILYLIAFGALWLAGCKNDPPAQDVPVPEILPPLDSIVEITTPDPYFLKKYLGKIDGKTEVEMVLINWGDGFLSGRYWYSNNKKKSLDFSGELNPTDNSFEIVEFDGVKEGSRFQGILHNPDSMSGTWISADGKRNMPFSFGFHPPVSGDSIWVGNWHLNQVWDNGALMIGNVMKDSFDFAINIIRGSHVGTLEGRASRKGNKAVYKKKDFEDEPCELVFESMTDHVKLDQLSSTLACGFGARAIATGIYEKKKFIRKSMLTVGTGEQDVFPTQALHDAFRQLVGVKAYEVFAFNMEVKERTTNKSGQTVISGAVPGLFTTNEAIIIYAGEKIWAATLDFEDGSEEPLVRYFTNDPASKQRLPADIELWREGFKSYKVIR